MTENNKEISLSIENNSQKSGLDEIDVTEKEMLKQIIEKQNEQDKINKEVIENQHKLMEELRLIRNEQNGRKRELKDKFDFIGNPAKRADLGTSAIDKSGQGELEAKTSGTTSSTGTLNQKSGKCFTLKHTFQYVSELDNNERLYSVEQEHFGINWRTYIYRNENHLAFFIMCRNKTAQRPWSIETDVKATWKLKNEEFRTLKNYCYTFEAKSMEHIRDGWYWGWEKYIAWNELETDYLIDDNLTFELSVDIKKTTGIYKNKMRSFDDKECSDIVLAVQDKKFHVSKLYLATHSPYFKAMFLGMFGESKKSEIPLSGVDADDFQNYLEVLYGDDAIDEYTVESILMVSDMYDTQTVIKKCQQFLVKESKKSLKKKLELSVRYNLEELKKQCLSEINTSNDIRAVLPANIRDMDHSLLADLLEKSLASD